MTVKVYVKTVILVSCSNAYAAMVDWLQTTNPERVGITEVDIKISAYSNVEYTLHVETGRLPEQKLQMVGCA